MELLENSIQNLLEYIEKEKFAGYDPYDILNSKFPIQKMGKWIPVIATQLHKRNPINLRPLLGIKKIHSTKGMGLLLTAYVKLYDYSKNSEYLKNPEYIKDWLLNNTTNYEDCTSWGYDYDYINPEESVKKGFPTVVHHSYIYQGLFEYYKIFNDENIKTFLIKNISFITNKIPVNIFESGISYSYNPLSKKVICYNASLHAAYCLAVGYYFTKSADLYKQIIDVVNFVISQQKEDGSWYYSIDNKLIKERKQIDFHQGFILESIYEIKSIINLHNQDWENSIKKGLTFYYNNQFDKNGKSFWRLPKTHPVDIHNQSQGIITFSKLGEYNKDYLHFAQKIAFWTISNMQSKKGYFYYRKYKFFINKISYMRWSQAWMLLALSILKKESTNKPFS